MAKIFLVDETEIASRKLKTIKNPLSHVTNSAQKNRITNPSFTTHMYLHKSPTCNTLPHMSHLGFKTEVTYRQPKNSPPFQF